MQSSNLPIFITAFTALIDTENATITYASAGHPRPYLIKPKTNEFFELTGDIGPAIGMMPDVRYKSYEIELNDGDMLFMFTDGLQELMNNDRIQFGKEELSRAISHNLHLSTQAFVESMIYAAEAFSDGLYTEDDVTLLVLKYICSQKA